VGGGGGDGGGEGGPGGGGGRGEGGVGVGDGRVGGGGRGRWRRGELAEVLGRFAAFARRELAPPDDLESGETAGRRGLERGGARRAQRVALRRAHRRGAPSQSLTCCNVAPVRPPSTGTTSCVPASSTSDARKLERRAASSVSCTTTPSAVLKVSKDPIDPEVDGLAPAAASWGADAPILVGRTTSPRPGCRRGGSGGVHSVAGALKGSAAAEATSAAARSRAFEPLLLSSLP